MEKNLKFAEFLLRIGVAAVFLYAAASSFLMPNNWIGFFPVWLRELIPAGILLFIFAAYEAILAIVLISGWRTFYAATVSCLTLFFIIAANISLLDIVFRDVAILFAALALAVLSYRK